MEIRKLFGGRIRREMTFLIRGYFIGKNSRYILQDIKDNIVIHTDVNL